MIRRKNLLVLLALPFAFVFGTINAYACTCGEATMSELRENASAVFWGRVVNKVRSNTVERDGVELTFEVTRVWKGNVGRKTAVYTGATADLYPFQNMCTPPFRVGESYLVFAVGREHLATNVCAGTKLLERAKTADHWLGPGKTVSRATKSKR